MSKMWVFRCALKLIGVLAVSAGCAPAGRGFCPRTCTSHGEISHGKLLLKLGAAAVGADYFRLNRRNP